MKDAVITSRRMCRKTTKYINAEVVRLFLLVLFGVAVGSGLAHSDCDADGSSTAPAAAAATTAGAIIVPSELGSVF